MKTIFEGKKLYAVIIAFLLMITFFITFYIIRNHYQYAFKNVITENTLTANLLSSLMYEHQKAATSILESYARRPLFIDAVKKKDFHRAFYHLKSLNEQHNEMDALFITDKSGTVWANYPVSKESYGKNLAYRDWYKGVSKKWRPYISTVFRLIVLEKNLSVAVAVPVFDRKGKIIGILGSTQRTPFLAAFLKGNIIDPQKSVTLLDQEGNIIFSNAVPYQVKITKYPDARVLEKALAGVIIDMEIADAKEKGSISYVSIAPVKGMGWSVIVGQEKNAILKSLYRYFILSAVTGFVIFLFLTVSLLYFRKEYKYRKTKELLQAGVALRESEERYRIVARLSSEFAYSCIHAGDDGYEVNWITDAFFTLTGYSEAKLHEQRCWLFVSHPDDREMATQPLRELKAGESDTREFRIVAKDGRVLYIINHMECQVDPKAPGGLRLFGAVQDITERKRMEEEKRRMEERSRKVVEDIFRFIPEGVLVFSRKMELLRQNQAFRELVSGYAKRLGFAEDELENLIVDKVKAGLRDNNIKEIRIARKHETREQT